LFDELALLQTISPRRLKIYFVLVETYTTFVDIIFQRFNGIAVKTGGAAFRMSDYTAVRKFFDKYFNGIVGRDMVSFKPFYIADPSHDYIQTDLFSVTANSDYSAFLISSNGGSSGENHVNLIIGIVHDNSELSVLSEIMDVMVQGWQESTKFVES
uniref:WS_DGAT_C domain-containing protein n=1 Tax=Haemonchus placei TaxID=6290 RepID=A0A0N4WNE5_HAEPC